MKLLRLIDAIGYTVITASACYFATAMGMGLLELRRQRTSLPVQGDAGYGNPHLGRQDQLHLYTLVPCLNEATVIGSTVTGLAGPRSTVVVIDDGSDDDTAEAAVRDAPGGEVVVLRRNPPFARQGKGEALNHGIRFVRHAVRTRGQDPRQVVVCVMDADGRLSDRALAHVIPLFNDPTTGGVQLGVRIRNRRANFLTWFQDYQFWSMAAVTQLGREATATVSLGGNGQFTRLSALDSIGTRPWSASLTEDLDLAISLALRGWQLRTTAHASVDQQAIEHLGRLIRQRTRWYQGHMTAIARCGEIWRSPHLAHLSALEMVCYLLVPWALDLPWSLLFQYCLAWFLLCPSYVILRHHASYPGLRDTWLAWPVGLLLWYLLAFAPALITSWAYLRRDRRVGRLRALLMGHSFVVMNYLSFLCAWKALFRMARGRTSWVKTTRESEHPGT
ncbi:MULTISPECIES: glycosyltransferase [unclassified Streptomyces]|uniref:glycosyltransferase n=1 Tax=unclassified Streptomyces TaxID=2593676 RepID=UPI0023655C0B|nr:MULTISPECIES: glycosyltransferase [unclassified Streptomyces]MDF3140938.1 glycosyltransferase [Streptomyces sp. T21Q-yed]WDF43611.1 glycosyltransferase [Streptomyces sp. T12]